MLTAKTIRSEQRRSVTDKRSTFDSSSESIVVKFGFEFNPSASPNLLSAKSVVSRIPMADSESINFSYGDNRRHDTYAIVAPSYLPNPELTMTSTTVMSLPSQTRQGLAHKSI